MGLRRADTVAACAAWGLSPVDDPHNSDPRFTRVRVRTEVPNGVNPGKGVTTGPNPAAREDAKKRVLQFFRTHLPAPPAKEK